jgi:glycine hydroxymethyltransferase
VRLSINNKEYKNIMLDKQIEKLIDGEKKRQKKVINLIASENYVSNDVLKALGSELTNKYAEGYPGARYYGGNELSDKIEKLSTQWEKETENLEELNKSNK